jgi:hypothetical protein
MTYPGGLVLRVHIFSERPGQASPRNQESEGGDHIDLTVRLHV